MFSAGLWWFGRALPSCNVLDSTVDSKTCPAVGRRRLVVIDRPVGSAGRVVGRGWSGPGGLLGRMGGVALLAATFLAACL